MKLANCRVSISRDSNDVISIELTDRDSGTHFFRGVMSFEDFARSVTGQCELPMSEAEVRGLERLGLVQEVKEVMLPIPNGYEPYRHDDFATDHAAWAKPAEVDGRHGHALQPSSRHRPILQDVLPPLGEEWAVMSKYDEAAEAMRYGPIVAKEEDRVALLREAINEALEEAAKVADRSKTDDERRRANSAGEGYRIAEACVVAASFIARDIRALKKEG